MIMLRLKIVAHPLQLNICFFFSTAGQSKRFSTLLLLMAQLGYKILGLSPKGITNQVHLRERLLHVVTA